MARGQSASFNANVNVNVVTSGNDEILRLNKLLSDVGTTIKTISSGNDLQRYWLSQEELVERLTNAVKQFRAYSSEDNASELIKTANALRAINNESFNDITAGIRGFNSAIEEAVKKAPTIDAAFSTSMFRGAFDAFDRLKSEGVNVESVFSNLASSESFEGLQSQVDRLRTKLSLLREENDSLRSASGLAEMQADLERATMDAEYAREKFESLFSEIAAAGRVEIFDSSIIDRFSESLDRLDATLVKLASGGYNFDGITTSASTATDSISVINSSLQESTTSGESAAEAVQKVITSLAGITAIDTTKIEQLNSAIRAIGNLDRIKISGSAIANVAGFFQAMDGLKNPSNIALMQTLDFSKFSELKVSKTSLSNIATQLGAISAVDVSKLQSVAALDFSNFSKLEVNTKALNSLSRLAERLTEASKKMSDIQLIVKGMTGGLFDKWAEDLENASRRTKKAAEEAEAAKTQIDEVVVGQRQAIANAINTATNRGMVGDADVDRQIGKLHEYDTALSELDRTSEDYEDTKRRLITQSNEVMKALNQEVKGNKMLEASQKQVAKAEAQSEAQKRKTTNTLASISKAQSKASDYLKQYTAAEKSHNESSVAAYERIRVLIPQYESLRNELSAGRISEEEATATRRQYNEELERSVSIIKQNGDAHMSLKDTFAALAGNVTKVMGVANTIRMIMMYARMLVKTTIELNDAFTQLRIVTGASDSQMEVFVNTATNLASALGRSVSEVTNSIETFSRLGYALEEASELARYASILSNVAAVDTNSATTGLTSIIKGYDMDVSDAAHVADVLVEVGQKYAISASELMEAFERSGAALNATNVTFEKSAALLAAANSSIQNASTVGTALKTVSARIRKSVSELEELGEDTDDLADGFSKYADEVKALTGVDIMLDKEAGVFRDLYDIFDDIAEVWDRLSDTQQARVAEIFGGTRQLQVISSIIGNWKDAESALETATNSTGAAIEANDVFMESTTAHINQLKAAWEKFANDLVEADVISFVVDVGRVIIEILDAIIQIIEHAGGLPLVLTAIATTITAMKLSTVLSDILGISSAIQGVGASMISLNAVLGIGAVALTAVITLLSLQAKAERERREAIEESARAAKKYLDNIDDETEALMAAKSEYESGKAKIDEYVSALEAEAYALGVTESRLKDVKNSTSDYTAALEEEIKQLLALQSLQLGDKVGQSRGDLVDKYNNFWSGTSVSGATSQSGNTEENRNAYAALSMLEKNGFISSGSYSTYTSDSGAKYSQGFSFLTDIDTSTADGVVKAYEQLAAMMTEVGKVAGTQNFVYQALRDRYNELSDAVNTYTSDLDEYNRSVAKTTAISKQLEEGLPSTREEFAKYRRELAMSVAENNEYTRSLRSAYDAADEYLRKQPEFESFYDSVFQRGSFVTEQTVELSNYLDELSEKIEDRSKFASILETAQQEMYNTSAAYTHMGGLSLDTIKSMMEATEDWVDYLYVENGVLMLNADAWQELANDDISKFFEERRAEIEQEAAAILNEISSLEKRNAEIDKALETTLPFTQAYIDLTEEQKRNSEQIKEYTDIYADQIERQLELHNALENAISGGTDPYPQALNNVENIATRISAVGNTMSRLASIQNAVADGFTLSLDKAMEFAAVYPQILDNATLSADGQLQLNEDVVNSLIEGEQASLRASIEADIAKLQAKNETAKAKLSLAQAEYEAISTMDVQAARSMLDTNKKYVEAIIQSGKSETEAYRIVANAMSQYMAQGGQGAANALSNYTEFMVSTIGSIVDAANQAAIAVSGIGSGTVKGTKVKTGGGKNTTASIQTLQQKLAGAIGGYQAEIASNEGQIAALQALLNTTLPNFNSSLGNVSAGGGGGGGGSSSSSTSNKTVAAANTWFDRLNTYHQHMVASEKETDADYFKWLAKAYKEAYQQGEITLEEYWKYEEQVAAGIKKIAEDAKNAFNNVLKETQNMIKQDLQNQKDKLNDKLDALKDYYQKQKDMLKDVADEEKYLREQSEKRKAVIDIQDQLDQLAYDDSAWAQRRRLELQQQLSDVSQDLDDFEKEHALNAALDEIDNAYNAQSQAIQREIDAIDEILNDPRALHNLALKEIVENTGGLYKALIEYNKKYGDGDDSTIKSLWEEWYLADSEYRKSGYSSYNGVRPSNATGATIPTAPSTQNTVQYADKLYGTSLASGSTIRVKASATNFGDGGSNAPLPKGVAGGSYTVYGVSADGNEVLIGKNGVYTGWIKRSDIQGYRYGTSNATPGFHRVNEGGLEELVFSSKDGNSYRMLNGGDKVLTGKATNFLYNFANAGAKLFSSLMPSTSIGGLMQGGVVNNITMSPITITGSADEKTVSELRRAQRSALDETLKAFNRLNK